MKPHSLWDTNKATYIRCAFEYGYIGVFLSWMLNVKAGIVIVTVCAIIHIKISSPEHQRRKKLSFLAWIVGAAIVDCLLIAFGITCSLQLIGGRVLGHVGALLLICEVALQYAAGISVARLGMCGIIWLLSWRSRVPEEKPTPLS